MKKLVIGYLITFITLLLIYPYFTNKEYDFKMIILVAIMALGTPLAWILIKDKSNK